MQNLPIPCSARKKLEKEGGACLWNVESFDRESEARLTSPNEIVSWNAANGSFKMSLSLGIQVSELIDLIAELLDVHSDSVVLKDRDNTKIQPARGDIELRSILKGSLVTCSDTLHLNILPFQGSKLKIGGKKSNTKLSEGQFPGIPAKDVNAFAGFSVK